MMKRRQFLQRAAAGAAVCCIPRIVKAESWPLRPVRAIIPILPGTGLDIVGRLVLEEISSQNSWSIVVENRAGAGGTIGATAAAKAAPDGYTILIDGTSHTIAPALYPNLAYDPVNDFTSVAAFGTTPFTLNVAPSKGFRTVRDLVTAAKANPRKLTYASAGVGSTNHLMAEKLRIAAGFEAVHVPVRGGGFLPDLLAGRIDFAFGPLSAVIDLIKGGQLRALAVASRSRTVLLPDVPTTLEAGYENSDFTFYVGMFVPAKTPRPIVDQLYRATATALTTERVRQKMLNIGIEPMLMTPLEFDAMITTEFDNNAALVKAIGLQPN
jgi:tripartite-type tricarboxylate transporter receptor subunit TctC